MSNFYNTIVFNRFPADKELFCGLLDLASEVDKDISTLLYLQPRAFERIYFTMTERELRSIAQRRGDPELADCFPNSDAVFSHKGRCIILHIPAMALKLSQIELRTGDPEGKILFTIHLFACFFHELGHAYHATRIVMNSLSATLFGTKPPVFDVTESEKIAEKYEEKLVKRFEEILSQNGLTWGSIADQLFKWEKLKPVLLLPRNHK